MKAHLLTYLQQSRLCSYVTQRLTIGYAFVLNMVDTSSKYKKEQ